MYAPPYASTVFGFAGWRHWALRFSVNKLAIAPDRCKAYSSVCVSKRRIGSAPLTKIGVWVDEHLKNMAYVACVREKMLPITV